MFETNERCRCLKEQFLSNKDQCTTMLLITENSEATVLEKHVTTLRTTHICQNQ